MNGSFDRDVALFTEALEMPAGERTAFLERACRGDAALRRRVQALIDGHEQVGDFLERSPHETTAPGRPAVGAGEQPGDRVGRYRLLQQIGEGGCGVVFMAEQQEPLRRRVALKIIKPGMDTKSVIARFEAERQALALMDHPSIAKIFDAGATESGRPYFVMELVRGIKITEYCDQHALTTEERLKLFIQVCQAIQHAHQKGIIHRDIKPSNILVTTTLEGATLPVVIDFGIAKATTNQPLTDKTLFTAFELLIGTPAYMSPEQAELTSADVDTRTDIYSLGVLLYELLTGSTPFDTGSLLKAGLDEIRRVIREQEPARPSTRLSKLTREAMTTVALHRQAEAPMLIRAVRGDLDWIAMKALEKDRTRRYETANGIALDVQRYLANEPISARPPSKFYRLQKTILRNKLLFVGLGVIALMLVLGLIAVSASLAQERKARREADAASIRSQAATRFLKDILNGLGPPVARGRDTAIVQELLDSTVTNIGPELSNQPAVEAELLGFLGKLYRDLGKHDQSEQMCRLALAICRGIDKPGSPEMAVALNGLGEELEAEHKYSEAETLLSEALAIRERVYGRENEDTATSLNDLSLVYSEIGRVPEADAMIREALEIRRKLSAKENSDIAASMRNLALILGRENKWAESAATAKEVLAMKRRLLGADHPEVAAALEDAAWAANGNGNFAEAQAMDEQALALRQKYLTEGHPDMGRTLSALGQVMVRRNNVLEGHTVLKAVLDMQRKLFGEDDPVTLDTLHGLAAALDSEGKHSEAESLWREIVAARRKLGDTENPQLLYDLRSLGSTLEAEGKWPEAESVWRDSLAAWRKRQGVEQPEPMYTLRSLGLALEAERKLPEAEAVFREALGVSRTKGEEDVEALGDLERLVRVLAREKKFGEGERLLDGVLTPDFVAKPASVNLVVARLDLRGRQARWAEAAADAVLAVDLQPTDHYRYHTLAALLAESRNRPAYEQLCKGLPAKFANSQNPFIAERVAQDCLLLPHSGVDLDLMDKQADLALALGGGDENLPYFQACKAMSNYRLGHFSEAVDWGQRAAKGSKVEAQAKAFGILAMAHWQLGQQEAARAVLAQGDALAPSIPAGSTTVDLGDSWMAWLMARISLDEATALIQSGSSTNRGTDRP